MKRLNIIILTLCMIFSTSVYAGKLILWNKLGSAAEVQNSEVGSNGEIVGNLLFEPAQHGNGYRSAPRIGDPNIPDNFVRFPLPGLGSKGTIEFWYHPDWTDSGVGHVVELIEYSIPENAGSLVLKLNYNDWQDRGAAIVLDNNRNIGAGEYFYPSSDPQWSTEVPIHIAYTWDASADKKVTFYINGQPAGRDYGQGGNPEFLWHFDETPYLSVGSRMYSGDWYRHNWEPNVDGIIDNIIVLDYAKTDFSDRFQEVPTDYRPTSKDQCKNGGWMNYYGFFKNQGQCIKYVNTGK